jgi:hypothetical protein
MLGKGEWIRYWGRTKPYPEIEDDMDEDRAYEGLKYCRLLKFKQCIN